jgi:endonuclease I
MKRFLLNAFVAIIALTGFNSALADIPTAYYTSVNGLTDADLKTALSTLLLNHQTVSSYNNLPSYFRKTDVRPGTSYWWDMYSDLDVDIYQTFGTYMNREHSFPKSWWGGDDSTPAYIDLNHLYPAEAKANQAKSNYPLGEVYASTTFDNGVTKVGAPVTGQGGGAALVFEPQDEYKGDFARTYFYMVTCYQDLTWATKYMYMLQQNTYPTLKPWAVELLLKWNKQDPVSDKETARNEQVYAIQNNRNPFIDYPELAEYIWGDKIGQKFYAGETSITGDPTLELPVSNTALEFGETAVGSPITSNLIIKGENLTGNLTITLYGTNRKLFSIPSTSVAASLANSETGYMLPVTYSPTETGDHTAKISISDGGLSGSVVVNLIGQALPVPTLSTLTATAATDITDSSYTANWTAAPEVVDYYIVARTCYANGTSSTEDIIAESNSLVIDDFTGNESYNVRSVRLGYQSNPSNEIYVQPSGVTGVETDAPLGWAPWPGGIRIACGETQTNARIFDLAGRLISVIPSIENNQIIQLGSGAYIIVTDQCHTPLRILVGAW